MLFEHFLKGKREINLILLNQDGFRGVFGFHSIGQNSKVTSPRRAATSPRMRFSSAGFLATKVTLQRRYGPASSHGTVEISFSVISHCETSSAFWNVRRVPSFFTAALGALT